MSKTLLVGPAGCGKTHAVLEAFEKSLRSGCPLDPDTFFVVPSAEHTDRIVSLLVQRGIAGFFYKRVTTLSRLIHSSFPLPDIPVASNFVRASIVRELLQENGWEYFERLKDCPGLIDLLLGTLTELKESCIAPGIFRSRMNKLKKFEPAFGPKYEALAALYEGYESKLEKRGFCDAQDTLKLLQRGTGAGLRARSRFKALWLDGFFDFSNLQMEYLKILCETTDEITVTLTMDGTDGREEAFEAVRSTKETLVSMGFKAEQFGSESKRTTDPALLYLQRNLFSEKIKKKSPSAQGSILFIDAVGIEGEIGMIAREIHKLYATGNYRYSDFAVLFRQIRNYSSVIAPIFSRYGIPVEIHERDRLKFSPWIGTVMTLLAIFRDGWKREDVLSFLKSGYVTRFGDFRRDDDWLSAFEAKIFENGVLEGRDAWTDLWKGEEALEIPSGLSKQRLIGILLELEAKFLAATTAEDHIRIFREAVYDLFGIPEISDVYKASVRRDAVSVRRFEILLQEIKTGSLKNASKKFSFEFFADQFAALAELDVYSLHERDKNRVQIYDVSLARQKEYKVVFVAGLLEKVFPIQIREDPVLSDWERQILNAELDHPLREFLPRQGLERYLFYLAVTRTSEKLYLCYPHIDLEGKESLRSFYLDEVQRLFGAGIRTIRQDLARPYPLPDEAITSREKEIAVMGGLREKVLSGCEECGEMSGLERNSLQRLLKAVRPVEAVIGDEKIRDGGYFNFREASPTRLEEFAKCPYRYFARRILRLQDPTEDITVRQKGNILHWVLEEYFRTYLRNRPARVPVDEFVSRKLEEAFRKYPLVSERKYRDELDRAEVREMLLDVLEGEIEKLETRSLRPAYLEYGFGSGEGKDAPALVIGSQDGEIKIQGRIDRIDLDPEGRIALIVDYKRTAKLDRSGLEIGTSLQLPLYILAVEKALGLKAVGGELYALKEGTRSGFYRKDEAEKLDLKIAGKNSLLDEGSFTGLLDRTLGFVRRFTREIRNLTILVRPRDCEKYCPYPSLCRIEKWRLPMILEEIRNEDKLKENKSG